MNDPVREAMQEVVKETMSEEERLWRRVVLNAVIQHLGEMTPGHVFDEYVALKGPVIEKYLPLIERLAQTGLLSVIVRPEALKEAEENEEITWEIIDAWDNGSIWLEVGEATMLKPKKQPEALACPPGLGDN